YRMFTSRAEHRLHLRQDNADERMIDHARALGLLSPTDLDRLESRVAQTEALWSHLGRLRRDGASLQTWLARPESRLSDILEDHPFLHEFDGELREKAEIRAKYRGYLDRERQRIDRTRGLETFVIPEGVDFSTMIGISSEGREKLARIRPGTVGQASRIAGVSPADVGVLLVELRRRRP
ncbi:MAG: tRNA uridine-5-carboxymethylaminomethyl(34) synthesis enzyme MnmG, partial [Gemmatimonadetes bacterium]|nr:tRNA uridine-5-carboxymethylaminomethyl(34) synthesis enzyme MnmG [Gemmatimonadota bacterium]